MESFGSPPPNLTQAVTGTGFSGSTVEATAGAVSGSGGPMPGSGVSVDFIHGVPVGAASTAAGLVAAGFGGM